LEVKRGRHEGIPDRHSRVNRLRVGIGVPSGRLAHPLRPVCGLVRQQLRKREISWRSAACGGMMRRTSASLLLPMPSRPDEVLFTCKGVKEIKLLQSLI